MQNAIFKADTYISVNVGLEHKAGDPFVVGALTGVLITGSGTASLTGTAADGYDSGVGNVGSGYASVALEGGFRLPVAAGTVYAVGDLVTINTTTWLISKAAVSGTQVAFGIVTHEPKPSGTGAGFVIVKLIH